MTIVDSVVKSIKLAPEEYHCLYEAEQILEEIYEAFDGSGELVNVSCDLRIKMREIPRMCAVLSAFITDFLWEVVEEK